MMGFDILTKVPNQTLLIISVIALVAVILIMVLLALDIIEPIYWVFDDVCFNEKPKTVKRKHEYHKNNIRRNRGKAARCNKK